VILRELVRGFSSSILLENETKDVQLLIPNHDIYSVAVYNGTPLIRAGSPFLQSLLPSADAHRTIQKAVGTGQKQHRVATSDGEQILLVPHTHHLLLPISNHPQFGAIFGSVIPITERILESVQVDRGMLHRHGLHGGRKMGLFSISKGKLRSSSGCSRLPIKADFGHHV
jgi:hypothetical protein